jgi:uncharacterized protein (DUF2147 family)
MRRLTPLVLAASLWAGHALAADPAEGEWLVQDGKAKVRITPCAGASERLCGNIVWLRSPLDEDGAPKHDAHNPDPSARNRPIVGLPLIRDFRAAGPGAWQGGKIYDPESGKTYDSKLRVAPDGTLKVAGCIAFICQTQTWRRVS